MFEQIKYFEITYFVKHVKSNQNDIISFSCEEAIQQAYGSSMALHRCLFVLEIRQEGEPDVFLHQ
jgi:hypothetical protein